MIKNKVGEAGEVTFNDQESKRTRRVFADAFAETNEKVTDVVIGPITFSALRKHIKDGYCPNNYNNELKRGWFGMLWGARVWVQKSADDKIICYHKNSKVLNECFPFIAESKKILKIEV